MFGIFFCLCAIITLPDCSKRGKQKQVIFVCLFWAFLFFPANQLTVSSSFLLTLISFQQALTVHCAKLEAQHFAFLLLNAKLYFLELFVSSTLFLLNQSDIIFINNPKILKNSLNIQAVKLGQPKS